MVWVSASERDGVALGLCGWHTYLLPVSETVNKVLTKKFVALLHVFEAMYVLRDRSC